MVDINKFVSTEPGRRSIASLLAKLLKGFGVVLSVIVILAAAENNRLGYAWRSAQLFVQGDDGIYGIGKRPDVVMDNAATNAGGLTTILAVGDIVDCSEPKGMKRDLTALASWVGLDDPLDPSKVAAVQVVELAKNWPDAPILALGDIVYRRGTPREFTDCFDPIWGEISDRTLPAPGNHEYRTPAAYAYFDYWGQQAGPERRGYYAVQHNNWLILSLNTEIEADPASAQGKWLAETLAASSEQCILAYYHRPAHSSKTRSSDGNEGELFEQLALAGTDIILNGHSHFYERTHPLNSNGDVVSEGGTVSFVVGTGGRSPAGKMDLANFTAKAVFREQGLLRLDLHNDSYGWAFHSVNEAAVLDDGRRECGSA